MDSSTSRVSRRDSANPSSTNRRGGGSPSASATRNGGNNNNDRNTISSTIGRDDGNTSVPMDGTLGNGEYPRPALPPPLPPVERGSASARSTTSNQNNDSSNNNRDGNVGNSTASLRSRPATASLPQGNGSSSVNNTSGMYPTEGPATSPVRASQTQQRPPLSTTSRTSRPGSAAPAPQQRAASAAGNRSSVSANNNNNNNNLSTTTRKSRAASASRPASRRSSSRGRISDENSSSPEVEELMPLPLGPTQPVDRFFVETHEYAANQTAEQRPRDAAGQPRNENELLLEQFAEYTDDDSFFSSGSTVMEISPSRMVNDPVRGRATTSVHETLQLRQLTGGRVPQDTAWNSAQKESWVFQVHYRAIALQSSSFFIFPAYWTPRVVVYNIMHHWAFELCLFFIILGYAIFQASWARYTAAKGEMNRPDFMLWADVFYTVIYGIEILFRLFASGFILHKRAFFRSPWHWLDTAVLVMAILTCTWWQQVWNFTAWRLIRCIKCLTYVPAPVRMKLLAKSLLRSTNKLIQSSFILVYFIFFFALIGLQLFEGDLRRRCVNNLTGEVTDRICRKVATGQYWFYWGHYCGTDYVCSEDVFPNPHFGFRSFDDIGHAMLSAFQIMTFQGWTSLLQETNDGMAVMAFLYYAFTICLCTYVVPSLFLGIFLEKLERTSRLFVLKQLDFFDGMLQEQKQRMSALVRLSDYVQRDDEGRITHYPAYSAKHISSNDESSNSSAGHAGGGGGEGKQVGSRNLRRTQWSDEQRLQLQLSLTRQRDVAEDLERKRQEPFHLRRRQMGRSASASRPGTASGAVSRHASSLRASSAGGRPSSGRSLTAAAPGNFALGGRIGTVQHHPAAHAIGASRQTDLPFATRQEIESDRLRFLDPYTSTSQLPLGPDDSAMNRDPSVAGNSLYGPGASSTFRGGGGGGGGSVSGSVSRPPLSGGSVLAARESVGVVPNRRSMSVMGSMARLNSQSQMMGGSVVAPSALHASTVAPPQEPYVVHDPEGGDFRYADTCLDKINIIRNVIHMFTEGYPRILTQYLWEHRMMQYRYGLMPLTYTNQYEQAALSKLRRRRAKERAAEREEMRLHGITPMMDDDDDDGALADSADVSMRETRWMREEGLVAGSLSPIRMAQNIKENAPITVFQWIMYFFIFANAVFNASRFDTMPEYWEMGTFVAGVCFSALFTLELLMRLAALGFGPFFFDLFNLIETTFVVISLFQLGFSRTNTISLFNWVRFLKMFRVAPINPMRRVTRVLIHGFPDMVYALIFFSLYMFMWLLIGMSFFGSRIGWIDYRYSDYHTRANFESFSHAAMAIAQAFSVNRDEWLYLSWSGMRVRGSYTVMYFIATVFVAFVFRFFFIAVLTWAWQSQEEREDYAASSFAAEAANKRSASRFVRLPWFDFTVWRSFKHIHGGFERRDVAPDEVYFLNEDMRRQLRIAEAKERSYKEAYERALLRQRGLLDENDEYNYVDSINHVDGADNHAAEPEGPQYIVVGGQLYRQQSLPHASRGGDARVLNERAHQPRYGRAHPATGLEPNEVVDVDDYSPRENAHTPPPTAASEHSRSMVNPLIGNRHSLAPSRTTRHASNAPSMRGGDPLDSEGVPSVAAQLVRLGRASDMVGVHEAGNGEVALYGGGEDANLEHLLLPGPRLRYKSVVESGHRVFERCLDCNTYKQMPLRAPPGVAQRTADALHAEHCHMAAARSSKQFVLNAILGYVRMQADHEVAPTKREVETILGQAWGCGMLLFETIENMSCSDLPEADRDWGRMLQALEMQQWILGLHVGEEQVGRATLAYVLAHQQKQEEVEKVETYQQSWQEYSFFALAPSNPVRRFATAICTSWMWEEFILLVIVGASVCLAVYAPGGGNNRDMGDMHNGGKYKALHILDDIFTVIFAVEMVLKWICMGVILPVGRAYFWHLWNIFDCFIVIISIVSWADRDIFLRYLKVMRLFRVLHMMRFLIFNFSAVAMARAIWSAIPTLANVCLIMLMNYIVWAIIFVSMFMNKMNYCSNASIVNRTECLEYPGNTWNPIERNFRNFYESLLTTFEVSTGAEWLDVMYSGVDSWSTQFSPRTNRHPYLGLVFIAYYYVSHFILFSLFVASLIYCYMVAKHTLHGDMAAGMSTEQQLWLRMQNMVMQLKPKTRLLPMGNPVSRFFHFLIMNKWFEAFMGVILTGNMITMALQWYDMSSTQQLTLRIFQWVWVGIFTVEVLIRLIALGPRFFCRWAYCWDLLVMCLSFIQIACDETNNTVPFNMNVLRMLRLGRFLHLVDMITPFRTHLRLFANVLKSSVPSIINITLMYMLSVFIFAVLGLHFLGYIEPYSGGYIDNTYNNFQTLVNSLIMVFRLGTLENWATMLRGSLDRGYYCITRESRRCGPTDWAPVYYVPIVICFYLLMASLYLAAIVDNYVTAVRMHSSVRRLHELVRFRELWSRQDPNNRLILSVPQLLSLLEELRLPLGLSDKRNRVELLRLLREYDIPDHNGYVYYYEVLLPLARRVMAISFAEENASDVAAGEEVVWRTTEGDLGGVGASPYAQDPNYNGRTVAEYFAATYVQAAYRRDRCMRDYYVAKSAVWRKSRATCEEQGLSYSEYGFGNWGLAYPDPREEGQERGFSLPEDAQPHQLPTYADPVNARIAKRALEERRRRGEDGSGSLADGQGGAGEATLLPSLYRSAIEPTEKKFGPDAPNAIRRHERRSDKLQRRRNLEEQERLAYEEDEEREEEEAERMAVNDLVEDGAQGDDNGEPSSYHPSQLRPRSSGAGAQPSILRRSMNSLYNADPNSSSYQPPLGTSPEQLRVEEQLRRSQARQPSPSQQQPQQQQRASVTNSNRASQINGGGTDSYYN